MKHHTERSPLSPQFLQWEKRKRALSDIYLPAPPRTVGHCGGPDSGFTPRDLRGTFGTHPLGIWLWQKEGGSSKCQHVNLDRLSSYLQRPSGSIYQQICSSTQQTAKSLQSCPTLCDPIDGSPPGSLVPGILQARTLKWVAISFSNAWKWKLKVKSLSRVWPSATPWTAAYQAPPSMGFSRQKYWSGVPLPSPLHSKVDG